MISHIINPVVKRFAKFYIKLTPIILCSVIAIVAIEQPTTLIRQANAETTSVSYWQDGVLMIELAPALCQINPMYEKYRQCREKTAYVTKGFDIVSKGKCQSREKLNLLPSKDRALSQYMPDKSVKNQTWRQYGSCGKRSAEQYFRQIIEFSSKIKMTPDISSATSTHISKLGLFRQLKNNNMGLMDSSVRLMCQSYQGKSILVRVDFCYKANHFKQCGKVLGRKDENDMKLCGDNIDILGYYPTDLST